MQGTDNKLQYYHDKLAKAIEDGVDFEEFREIFKEYWNYTVDKSNTLYTLSTLFQECQLIFLYVYLHNPTRQCT